MSVNTWLYATKWNGEKSYDLIKQASNILADFGYHVKLDETKRNGFGTTEIKENNIQEYTVGVREIYKNPRMKFSLDEALKPTVACFHEVFGHGGQWRNEAQKNTPLSKVLLLNDLACKSSRDYYGASTATGYAVSQYFEQPHEIAAQYMGLKMCQRFLSALYGDREADGLLCEYVNLRAFRHNAFITNAKELIRGAPEPPKEPELDLSQLTQADIDFKQAVERLGTEKNPQKK